MKKVTFEPIAPSETVHLSLAQVHRNLTKASITSCVDKRMDRYLGT